MPVYLSILLLLIVINIFMNRWGFFFNSEIYDHHSHYKHMPYQPGCWTLNRIEGVLNELQLVAVMHQFNCVPTAS